MTASFLNVFSQDGKMDIFISNLMNRMTLEEKIGQMNMPCVYVDEMGKDIPGKTEA